MPQIRANGLNLEYDTFGDVSDPPMLLIMGLGAQMIAWHEEFCQMLAGGGFHVIRFDNRDSGLSTKLDSLGSGQAAYSLSDLAADAAALLDALGISAAHLVGASMGGAIAQLVAIEHPEKVLSLTSIMSWAGSMAENERGTPEAIAALMQPMPEGYEARLERSVEIARVLAGRYFEEDEVRSRAARAIDRGVSVDGTMRQFAAIGSAPGRSEELRRLRVPALVIHGEADPLVPVSNGRQTADAIPGAHLLTFPDMGHDRPRPLWPEITEAIAENARPVAAVS